MQNYVDILNLPQYIFFKSYKYAMYKKKLTAQRQRQRQKSQGHNSPPKRYNRGFSKAAKA